MKDIFTLSKYIECYDRWKIIKDRFQLEWSDDNSVVFKNIDNNQNNYSTINYY